MHNEEYVEDPEACPRCRKRGKTWEGSNPKCAFRSGKFDTDNWNCKTLSDLRALIRDKHGDGSNQGFTVRDDSAAGSIGVLMIPEHDDIDGYLCLTWYKDRGRTERAYILSFGPARELTLFKAEMILELYGK